MADDSFILVNLKEGQAKRLAQIISNDTSRKILDYLSQNKDGTATSIAKSLEIPLSTAHYNLKHLLEAKLVQVDEFHYSDKGKEVDHYKLSNKFVIIAPETSKMDSIKEQLGKILPVGVMFTAVAGVVALVKGKMGVFAGASEKLSSEPELFRAVADEAVEAAPMLADAGPAPEYIMNCIREPNYALWFLAGGLVALLMFLAYSLYRRNR